MLFPQHPFPRPPARSLPHHLHSSELTLDNGLLRNFDDIVRRQLDPVWHTVSFRTKQICKVSRDVPEACF